MIDIVVKFYIVLFTLIHQKKKKKNKNKKKIKRKKEEKRKNAVFDSKKRFKKIIERFYNGFMSDFSIQLIESLFLKAI